MRTKILIMILNVCFAFLSHGQSLEKKALNDWKAAERSLDKIERNLKKMEDKPDKANINAVYVFEGQIKGMERDFQKVEDKLNGLPSTVSEVKESKERKSALAKRWTKVQQAYKSAGEASTIVGDDWEAFENSEEHKRNMEILDAYESKFRGFFKLKEFVPWLRTYDEGAFKERMEMVQSWDKIQKEVKEIRVTYEAYGRLANAEMSKVKRVEERFDYHKTDLDQNIKDGISYLQKKKEKLDFEIKDAFERHQAAINYGQAYTGIDEFVLNPNKNVMIALREAERSFELMTAYDPGFEQKAASMMEEMQSAYEKAADQAAEYTMKSKQKPVNEYHQADYDQMVAIVKQRFSNQNVLGVYFEPNWSRTNEYRFDASMGSVRKYDYSTLNGRVLLEHNGEYALERYIYVQKDHQSGNSLRLFGDFRMYGANPPLRVLFPKSKL